MIVRQTYPNFIFGETYPNFIFGETNSQTQIQDILKTKYANY